MSKRWKNSQKMENEYHENLKHFWNIEHNLEYWNMILHMDFSIINAIEIGCGNVGIFNFAKNVIGLDSLSVKKSNFVCGVAEYLPFRVGQTIIFSNVLDHTSDAEKSLKEVMRIADELIFSSNIFNPIVSFFLNIFDRIHPYHFTRKKLKQLFEPYDFIFIDKHECSVMRSLPEANCLETKFKVLLGAILGTKAVVWRMKINRYKSNKIGELRLK